MESTSTQPPQTRQQILRELLESVHRAKVEFQNADADNRGPARESYVRALDELNKFLRSEKIPGAV